MQTKEDNIKHSCGPLCCYTCDLLSYFKMWKIIFLSSLLLVTQAANLENLFSTTWSQVAFYPRRGYVPACIEFYFDKASHDTDCTCSDGKNATLVAGGFLVQKAKGQSYDTVMIAIDSPSEIVQNVNCTCGLLHFTSRAAVREINDNYIIMYDKTPDNAYVYAKEVPKQSELITTLQNIEDLKDKSGAIMCATDIYD